MTDAEVRRLTRGTLNLNLGPRWTEPPPERVHEVTNTHGWPKDAVTPAHRDFFAGVTYVNEWKREKPLSAGYSTCRDRTVKDGIKQEGLGDLESLHSDRKRTIDSSTDPNLELPSDAAASTSDSPSRPAADAKTPSTPQNKPRSNRSGKSLEETPAKHNRSHATARMYLGALLLKHKMLHCAISRHLGGTNLQFAHIVSRSVDEDLLERLAYAIGGRFWINSRLNYLLLYVAIHKEWDAEEVIIYFVCELIIKAMEEYLSFLDKHEFGDDGGRIEWFKALRESHPVFRDGTLHEYSILSFEKPVGYDSCIPYRGGPKPVLSDYHDLPSFESFAHPFFITLKAIYILEHRKDNIHKKNNRLSWNDWIDTGKDWEVWIRERGDFPSAAISDPARVAGLARFLRIAQKLRIRLGQDFSWGVPKKSKSKSKRAPTPSGNQPGGNGGSGGGSGGAEGRRARGRRGGQGGGGGQDGSQGGNGAGGTAAQESPKDGMEVAPGEVDEQLLGMLSPAQLYAAEWRRNNPDFVNFRVQCYVDSNSITDEDSAYLDETVSMITTDTGTLTDSDEESCWTVSEDGEEDTDMDHELSVDLPVGIPSDDSKVSVTSRSHVESSGEEDDLLRAADIPLPPSPPPSLLTQELKAPVAHSPESTTAPLPCLPSPKAQTCSLIKTRQRPVRVLLPQSARKSQQINLGPSKTKERTGSRNVFQSLDNRI